MSVTTGGSSMGGSGTAVTAKAWDTLTEGWRPVRTTRAHSAPGTAVTAGADSAITRSELFGSLRGFRRLHRLFNCAYMACRSADSCDLTQRVVSSASTSWAPASMPSRAATATSRGSALGASMPDVMSVST